MSLPNELVCIKYAQEKQSRVKEAIAKSKDLNHILGLVSKETGMKISLLKSKSRLRELTEARAAYGIIARERNSEDNVSLETIGDLINRNHTTITHYTNNLSHIQKIKNIVKQIR